MGYSVSSELLAALDILIAERVDESVFHAVKPLPDFFHCLFGPALSTDGATLRFDQSPFLMNFLDEAERFWSETHKGRHKSGPWIEADEKDREYALEVSALSLGEKKYLIIELLGTDFEERRNRLQVAREMFLSERHARKRAEEEGQDSKERYQTVFESAKDAILLMKDDRFVDCNVPATEMFRCDRNSLLGRTLSDLSPKHQPEGKDSGKETYRVIKTALRGQPQLFEWQFQRNDGSVFDGDVSLSPLELSGSKHVMAFIRDVTERKRAEQERRRLATAIEQAAETIIITESTGTILYTNPAFERTSGFSAERALGKKLDAVQNREIDGATFADLWKTISQGEVWSGRFINTRKDGTVYEEDATISPVKDASGKIVNYVSVHRDVTKEVLLEARLRQAQKMEAVGRLASGISHDFNNVLNGIIGLTELALDDSPEGTDQYSYLEQAVVAAHRATDLVKQIVAFSRKSPLEKKRVNLSRLVKEVLRLIRASKPRNVRVEESFPSGNDMVMADPTQIHQVLMNLCTNAYQAMQDKGGTMNVSVETVILDEDFCEHDPDITPGRYVRLTVGDSGKGIPREHIDRVFEPYFTTKKKGEGTGLGLAVVHGIVRSHEGTISINSQAGEGTSVHVYLPTVEL
jgi:two-component system cell cycle sensor histidine kinase/response regulator CckA